MPVPTPVEASEDPLAPAGHLFTGVDYVPISEEELEFKTARIKRTLALAWSELLEVCDRQEWRASKKFASFHDYCMKNFEISGRSGYYKAAAQRVNNVLLEHGMAPIKERMARIVSDRPPQEIVDVIEAARRLSDTKNRTGKAAQYHTPGKLSSRLVEEARRLVVPEAPAPRDAPLVGPLPPKRAIEREPIETPVHAYHVNLDAGRFGKVYHFDVEGKKYYLHVRASDFAEFFESDTAPIAGTFVDPFEAD